MALEEPSKTALVVEKVGYSGSTNVAVAKHPGGGGQPWVIEDSDDNIIEFVYWCK